MFFWQKGHVALGWTGREALLLSVRNIRLGWHLAVRRSNQDEAGCCRLYRLTSQSVRLEIRQPFPPFDGGMQERPRCNDALPLAAGVSLSTA